VRKAVDQKGERNWKDLLALARAADGDELRCRLREALGRMDRKALEQLASSSPIEDLPVPTAVVCGHTLRSTGAVPRAEVVLRAAQRQHPEDFWINFTLAETLEEMQPPDWDGAIRFYTAALAVRPSHAAPVYNLGHALKAKGRLDEAVCEYRAAIELDPKYALPHNGLGVALRLKGQPDEAIREFHKAIALDPKFASPHNGLGNILQAQGQRDEAIREYRIGIELDPNDAAAHNNLGIVLKAAGQLEEAAREFHKAIELDPKIAHPHAVLARTLFQLGRFAEAREAGRRSLELLPPEHPLRPVVTSDLRQCEESLALEDKLDAIRAGKEKPTDDAQRLVLARLCQQPFKKLYAASFRFYRQAFANDPKLADDLERQHRYNAACAAALAGCGQGNDAANLNTEERARLRKQSHDWLNAQRLAWQALLEKEPGKARLLAAKYLAHWLEDTDFAGVRGPEALAKLPEAERQPWQKLWADVADLLARAAAERKFDTK
jgi:tetratricopeptide (TPR) repeat protein